MADQTCVQAIAEELLGVTFRVISINDFGISRTFNPRQLLVPGSGRTKLPPQVPLADRKLRAPCCCLPSQLGPAKSHMDGDSEAQASESREGKARAMLVNLIPTKDSAHLGRQLSEASVGRVLV